MNQMNQYNFTSTITQGLTHEIELRQKQYEYYRNQLLTFNNVDSATSLRFVQNDALSCFVQNNKSNCHPARSCRVYNEMDKIT